MAAYGNGERGVHLALEMLLWTDDVVLFTDGEELVATEHERRLLEEYGIEVVEIRLKRLYGEEEEEEDENLEEKEQQLHRHLAGVELIDGRKILIKALFFNTGRTQASELPDKLGLTQDERSDVVCCQAEGTVKSVDGLYVAGKLKLYCYLPGNSIIKSDRMFQMTKLLLCWHQYPFLFYCQRTVGLHLTSDGTLMSIYLSLLADCIYHFSNPLLHMYSSFNPLISLPIHIYTQVTVQQGLPNSS